MRSVAGALPLAVFWLAPLAVSLAAALWAGLRPGAWHDLLGHPQLWPGLWLSLSGALISTGLSLAVTLLVLAALHRSRAWKALQAISGAGLAVPHLAFAIGFAFLTMPSGLVARIAVGGDQPPPWVSVHDPMGLALAAALTLKEIPFLLLLGWTALSRGDAAAALDGQIRAARSLGHGEGSIWLRIVAPQLLHQLRWPIVIVFVYAASVVDMALVLGPSQPPPLAVVIWRDLNDAEPWVNARGAAGALFLGLALATTLACLEGLRRISGGMLRPFLAAGPSPLRVMKPLGVGLAGLLVLAHGLAFIILGVLSFASLWPYPDLWPDALSSRAWATLAHGAEALWLSLGLAVTTAITAVLLAVAWFETQPARRDSWLVGIAVASLVLPPVLLAAGLYRALLGLGWEGTLAGLFIAHLGPVAAYVLIVMTGPYRAFDARYTQVAHGLSVAPWRSFVAVKLALLKATLLAALAVGFAVSIVQYVPAQLAAAGRTTTLPIEAVTLASGGDRALTAAYALALALPPLIVFALAGVLGRPRWR